MQRFRAPDALGTLPIKVSSCLPRISSDPAVDANCVCATDCAASTCHMSRAEGAIGARWYQCLIRVQVSPPAEKNIEAPDSYYYNTNRAATSTRGRYPTAQYHKNYNDASSAPSTAALGIVQPFYTANEWKQYLVALDKNTWVLAGGRATCISTVALIRSMTSTTP